ncbi:hypothetical protein AB6C96_12135 [Vibrio cyclitrophicus]
MEQLKLESYKEAIDDNYYLILTSNSKEKSAINKIITHRRNLELEIPNRGASIGVIGDVFVVHITGTSGGADRFSTSIIASQFIAREKYPLPKFVVLVGFCWGNPKATSIGDILLSSQVVSLNSQVANTEGLNYKGKYFTSSLNINNEEVCGIAHENGYSLKVGDMASLDLLLSSSNVRDQIVCDYPNVVGGEMEAYALLPSLADLPWLVIKTVSDLGDNEFNRNEQVSASEQVSKFIQIILPKIISDSDFYFNNSTPHARLLLDSLLGGTIKIDRSTFTSDSMNDYLNDVIGPQFIFKLSQYSSGVEYDEEFPYVLADFLLEVAQNAFKYGESDSVSISFNNSNVSIYESNKAYDARKLSEGNGGSDSWNRLSKMYIDNADVSYSVNGKCHKITLKKINKYFKKIINECSAVIIPSTIRSGFITEVLSSNDECEEVYVDVSEIFMSSRRMDVISDVKRLVGEGKYIYISCRNESEVERYKANLVDCLESLRVFVG